MTEFKHTPDSLADQLEQTLPAGATSNAGGDADPLVDAAMFVAQAPRPGLPADARARIHDKMLQHARQQPAPLRPQFNPIFRWALIACAIIVVMLIPTAQVTLASVPGDALYPVKLSIEQIEIGLANSPAAQASLNLTHAERRTQEAQTLLSRGQFDSSLIPAAYENMSRAAAIVSGDPGFDPGLRLKLQSQTAALVAAIDSLLISATQPDQPLVLTVTPLLAEIHATQDSSFLLLPATATTTLVPTFTITPSAAITQTSTHLPTQTHTPSHTSESTLTPTAEPTESQAVNLIVTGPVEAINGNIIVIYGIEIAFDADDPILLTLRVGDNIRISGIIGESSVVISVINAEPADDSVAISPDGQSAWRDTGDCSNPPPPWATANGWRRRCEGQTGNSNQNNSGNQGRGLSQGRGNSGRSDDDD